ncbi:hypothetical protein OAA64_00790 [bacterium]|nr:hypothetical protein [bacterium]
MGTKRVGLARVEALMENLKRDLALGGGSISGQKRATLVTTADVTLTDADSGKLILCNGASAHDIALPTAAAGLYFKFVITNVTADVDIVQAAGTEDFVGGVACRADAVGDTAVVGDTKVSFKAGQAVIGDTISLECDGTLWHVSGLGAVAASIVFA